MDIENQAELTLLVDQFHNTTKAIGLRNEHYDAVIDITTANCQWFPVPGDLTKAFRQFQQQNMAPANTGNYFDPLANIPDIQISDEERAARIAILRAAANGIIPAELAEKMQQEISDKITIEGRGGLDRFKDIHYALGAGKLEADECYTRLDPIINRYMDELKQRGEK